MAKMTTDELLGVFEEMTVLELKEFLDAFEEKFDVTAAAPVAVAAAPAAAVVPAPAPLQVSHEATAPSTPPPAVPASRSDLVDVTAPMVGTFYRAPAPGEAPFVEVGTRIGVGQTICILEAMKLMNELEAEAAGEVVEILVDNGTPVEFGQVLMRVKPG